MLSKAGFLSATSALSRAGEAYRASNLLVNLSETLSVPLRERNALLLAAGYAPLYGEEALDDATMKVVRNAIDQMLANHGPHPALLMDRYWNVIRTDAAATAFFGCSLISRAFRTTNLLDLTFDPAGRPHIEDWESFASGLLQRVRREALGLVVDDRLQRLLDGLKTSPGIDTLPLCTNPENPVLPITFRRGNSASPTSRW